MKSGMREFDFLFFCSYILYKINLSEKTITVRINDLIL